MIHTHKKMDSENDASKQVSHHTNLSKPGCSLSTLQLHFCDSPFCLGDIWHEWGVCSNEVMATMDFDNVDNDLLDGCGFDGNAVIPANKVGGVAE